MNSYLTLGLIIIAGWVLARILHSRSYKSLLENLKLLAGQKNGTIKKGILFSLPKLHFIHDGKRVELSSASTGVSGESQRYTYVLISGMDFKGFEFRILPKSVQTIVDDKIGIKKQISTENPLFDKYLSVYSNDKDQISKILKDEIKSDLLKWAQKKPINKISDIRNYDDKLIFCVYGELKDRYEFERLLKSAINFYHSLKEDLLNFSKIAIKQKKK
jgi:hypothetical protein